MTRDYIIKLAQEAGFDPHDMSADFTCNLTDIERFAALVIRKGREMTTITIERGVVEQTLGAITALHAALEQEQEAPPRRLPLTLKEVLAIVDKQQAYKGSDPPMFYRDQAYNMIRDAERAHGIGVADGS